MEISVWAAFAGLSFLYCLAPGSSVCFTIAHSIRHGTARTSITILGQLTGNALYITLACLGLGGLVTGSNGVFRVVQYAGGAYVIYLGIKQLLSRGAFLDLEVGRERKGRRQCFLDGFAVCGLNPKTLIYYAAFLPQFVLPRYDKRVQLVSLGLASMVIALAVLMIYNFAGERARLILMEKSLLRYANAVVGSLFVVAGLILGFF